MTRSFSLFALTVALPLALVACDQVSTATHHDSGQGGYLGSDVGKGLEPAPRSGADMRSSPTAWCAQAPDPSRCRARAAEHDEICKDASNYMSCRAAIDQMYSR
jgi:hypothetical protein